MNTLGVILARAGSVGLKSKHLQDLCGRPVISYTFDAARRAMRLTRVVVTTDCPIIRKLGIAAGFETVSRPPELATGDASVQATLLHAMKAIESSSHFKADAIVTLYGNVPLRGEGVIDEAIEKLEETGCDSVRSFCPVGKWHPVWMAKVDGDVVDDCNKNSIHRRQDLQPMYLHDGAVIAVSRASMLRGVTTPDNPHAFFGEDRRGIYTEMGETVEIDHQRDLYWAEAVLRDRRAAGELRKAS